LITDIFQKNGILAVNEVIIIIIVVVAAAAAGVALVLGRWGMVVFRRCCWAWKLR
jgi:hypothetical protein